MVTNCAIRLLRITQKKRKTGLKDRKRQLLAVSYHLPARRRQLSACSSFPDRSGRFSWKRYPEEVPVDSRVHPGVVAEVFPRRQLPARNRFGSLNHAGFGKGWNPSYRKIRQALARADGNRQTSSRTGPRWPLHPYEQKVPVRRPSRAAVACAQQPRGSTVQRSCHHCGKLPVRRIRNRKHRPPPAW
jgi:hypothetical protein